VQLSVKQCVVPVSRTSPGEGDVLLTGFIKPVVHSVRLRAAELG
jgi:hypothetical protein